ACLTAAVPDFWQQFPKAVEAEGRCLRIGLFPGQFDDLFELQGGEQKTHDIWLHVGPPGPKSLAGCEWVYQPVRVHAQPEWYAGSGALPYLFTAPIKPETPLGALLDGAVHGPTSLVSRREIIDEYGWRHFGEIYADHEGAYYQGPAPVISHYNNQYDVIYGA